MVLIFHYFKVL